MAQQAGSPPEGENIRSIVEERLAQSERENGEKLTIEWRGSATHLHVIAMPVGMLYYNPDTHRIRAQRGLDPKRDAVLNTDPWGPDGQDYLEYLLKTQPATPGKTDPEFEALRDSLEDFSQEQPGLITPDGILVNGNTRCAALRELGKRHIRVAVLPADTTREDISAVELSLQLRRENKRDYSYINQLIAIEEQLARGRRPEEIAREFHIRPKTLEQDRWVYGLIQEAIERSSDSIGDGLRLVDFEDHQEKLRELYRAYTKEMATDRDAAEALKESRLAMIILGFAKTDVRLAKPDFYEKYLAAKLPTHSQTAAAPSQLVLIPGLGMSVPDDSTAVKAAREITDGVLRARAALRVGKAATNVDTAPSEKVLEELRGSVEAALKSAGRDERLRQRKVAAAERLSDATDAIDLASADVAQSLATKSLDEDALDESLTQLRSSLEKLARQIKRAVSEPGAGVEWLVSSIRMESP